MENQTEKIKRYSEMACILLDAAFVVFIIIGILEVTAWLWSVLGLQAEIVTVNGLEIVLPPLLWESGVDSVMHGSIRVVGVSDFLRTVSALVGLWFAKNVFKLLQVNGSPFRKDVVKALKKLSIALLCMGMVTSIISLIAAGIVWMLCLIFNYGCSLQDESDTTL
ncbi:MAG: hypothetical protein LBE76_03535 [Nitrososphaerota archaeon]|jgi:hypothetical protein|nr:hypothetical protein [Nitrososphaerota archaeon]